jgi:uncharacterized protein (TIGR02265 family)
MRPDLPIVAAYLAKLPGGADAFPECSVKASLVRNALDDRPLSPDVPLPAPVRALVDRPPPVSVWVPEVHFHVVMLAILEAHFGGRSDAGYLAWVHDQNARVLSTPLYRVLFLVVSPERLVVGMQQRWGAFRRGTEPRLVTRGPRDVELRVHSPPHLYGPLNVEGMSHALRAAVECAGARDARVEGEIASPTEVVYRFRWR